MTIILFFEMIDFFGLHTVGQPDVHFWPKCDLAALSSTTPKIGIYSYMIVINKHVDYKMKLLNNSV